MKLFENKLNALKSAVTDYRNLQLSFKGNAEFTLHDKNPEKCPKGTMELIQDEVTVNVSDLVLAGAAVCGIIAAVSLLSDVFKS